MADEQKYAQLPDADALEVDGSDIDEFQESADNVASVSQNNDGASAISRPPLDAAI